MCGEGDSNLFDVCNTSLWLVLKVGQPLNKYWNLNGFSLQNVIKFDPTFGSTEFTLICN